MKVSINMAMSMDGKIATAARGPVKLGSDYDSLRMAEIRSEHDVVINGATTFEAYPYPLRAEGFKKHPVSAVVSSRLKISRGTPWEKATDAQRWIFCGQGASLKTIASLRKAGIKVLRGRGARPSPKEILTSFKRGGLSRVLLEGGGEFNASFLEADLVDTIHLTLVPIVVGGEKSPTWCEGVGFKKGKFLGFTLRECRQVGEELYLTYSRAR